MAEPRGAQSAAGELAPNRTRIERGQWRARDAPGAAAKEFRQRRWCDARVAQPGRNGLNIAERLSGPERRRLHALETQTLGFHAQCLHDFPLSDAAPACR